MTLIDHALRASVLSVGAAVSYVGSIRIVAQSLPGVDPNNVWLAFIEKGGGWAVLMVVLWAYRRDYKRLSEGETARADQLIALHEKTAKATQDVAVALSRNTEVLRMVSAQVHGHNYEPREQRREDLG